MRISKEIQTRIKGAATNDALNGRWKQEKIL